MREFFYLETYETVLGLSTLYYYLHIECIYGILDLLRSSLLWLDNFWLADFDLGQPE